MTYSTIKKKLAVTSTLLNYACEEAPCDLLCKNGKGWPCCDYDCPIEVAKRFILEKEKEIETDDTLD